METSLPSFVEGSKGFEDLEEEVFQWVCQIGRELIRNGLEALDWALSQGRSPGLRLVGKRSRTFTTKLGDVTFERRLYRERGRGGCRFLLDEALKLPVKEGMSKGVAKLALFLAAVLPFRRAVEVLRRVLPQAFSATTLQRLVWRFGERVEKAEAQKQEATFGDGEVPEMGEEVISRLLVEADGVSVALQQEKERRGEVKVGIGYTGWERMGYERYGVIGKVVHAGVEEPEAFWERFWLGACKRYDLSRLEYAVLNGDGAEWIAEGLMGIPGVHQLDHFHLWRSLRQAFCGEEAWTNEIYREATQGSWERVEALIAQVLSRADLPLERRQAVKEAYQYMAANREGLRDWRHRVKCQVDDRSLGAMEGNVDKIIAIRTKRRGMSWRRKGLHSMAKLLQCVYEGEVSAYACAVHQKPPTEPKEPIDNGLRTKARGHDTPFNAGLPALIGPQANRPWARLLKALSNPYPIS